MLPTNMLEIFQYDFMQRALLAAAMIGILAPTIGMFLVVRGYSLLADTLSHVSLVGVAIGVLLGINPLLSALVIASIGAVGMDRLRQQKSVFGESSLALFLSGSLAIALILLSLSHGINVNIFGYLFGSITTVTWADLATVFVCGLIVAAIVFVAFKKFFLIAYAEDLARANGLNVSAFNAVLMISAAIVVALSMQIVGVLLVGALMVIPVLTAMQYGKSFAKTLVYAIIFSLFASIVGLILSFYLNLPSGPAIVIVALCLFALSLFIKKEKASAPKPLAVS